MAHRQISDTLLSSRTTTIETQGFKVGNFDDDGTAFLLRPNTSGTILCHVSAQSAAGDMWGGVFSFGCQRGTGAPVLVGCIVAHSVFYTGVLSNLSICEGVHTAEGGFEICANSDIETDIIWTMKLQLVECGL